MGDETIIAVLQAKIEMLAEVVKDLQLAVKTHSESSSNLKIVDLQQKQIIKDVETLTKTVHELMRSLEDETFEINKKIDKVKADLLNNLETSAKDFSADLKEVQSKMTLARGIIIGLTILAALFQGLLLWVAQSQLDKIEYSYEYFKKLETLQAEEAIRKITSK